MNMVKKIKGIKNKLQDAVLDIEDLEKDPNQNLVDEKKKQHEKNNDIVDESSEESFPASDPPSWVTGKKDKK